jgi:hypothetical protein
MSWGDMKKLVPSEVVGPLEMRSLEVNYIIEDAALELDKVVLTRP